MKRVLSNMLTGKRPRRLFVMRLAGLLVGMALHQVEAVFRFGLLEAAGLSSQNLGWRRSHRGADHDERQRGGEKHFLKPKVTPVSDYAALCDPIRPQRRRFVNIELLLP